MKIKICGLKRECDISYVNTFQPDYVGFVFAGNKRKLTIEQAAALKEQLRSDLPSVGVFVNEDIQGIRGMVSRGIIDVIHLHGDEDETYVKTLRNSIEDKKKITIIKAIRVKSPEQILQIQEWDVDYLLLDTYTKEMYGGSGVAFDHSLIPSLKKPYFLAGGINEENVMDILDSLKENLPYCIDVSSSVETNGYKDKEKIERIIKLVHGYKGKELL